MLEANSPSQVPDEEQKNRKHRDCKSVSDNTGRNYNAKGFLVPCGEGCQEDKDVIVIHNDNRKFFQGSFNAAASPINIVSSPEPRLSIANQKDKRASPVEEEIKEEFDLKEDKRQMK